MKLPGGLWIVTERAVASESGEPVDPVQAALGGSGVPRSTRNRRCAANSSTATDHLRPCSALANLLATPDRGA